MTTKSRIRTTIELNSGDKERLQNIALSLGIIQPTGPESGKAGSVSQLMQAIARGEVKVIIDRAYKEAQKGVSPKAPY